MKGAKEFLQEKYPSMKAHWNETNIDDEWVASMMETYARLQIEKDRERVKEEYYNTERLLSDIIKETPIILD